MKRRFTLLAIATFVSTSLMAAWDGTTTAPTGTGTTSDPYLIATPENLAWIASDAGDLNKVYKQTADLDLGNKPWTPIGNSSKKFTGSYDGDGFVINNLYYSDSSAQNVGLFGYISGATLTNITVASGFVYGYQKVAGICGNAETGATISYCANCATVYGKMEQNGGVCGVLSSSTITNCINYGLVSGFNFTGGVLGRTTGIAENKVINCINVGQVFGMRVTCGNLIGFNDDLKATITNCYYDNQINPSSGVTGSKTSIEPVNDESGRFTGLSTSTLCNGNAPSESFSSTIWSFDEGLYPRLQINKNQNAIILAATPVFLNDDKADNVTKDFTVCKENNVSWTSGNTSNLSINNGSATIKKSTAVVLTATKGNYTKKVYLKTNKAGATAIGSSESPLTIENKSELIALRDAVKYYGSYKGCANYDGFKGIHFKVMVDIAFNENEWNEPIGVHNSFKGIFEGNHRSISGVKVNQSDIAIIGGLFGCASYGEINNINITNGTVCGVQFVGGICGSTFKEKIENCTSNCTININSNSYAGGIVGVDKGYSILTNCENTGAISGNKNIGGIMGNSNMGSEFNNCKNSGEIKGTENIGGICGNNGIKYINCENHGKVTGSTKNSGGIAGTINISGELIIINNCINTGTIKGGDAACGIGGRLYNNIEITNCLNTGEISGTNISGICSMASGSVTVSDSFNAGEINAETSGNGISAGASCTNCINIGEVTNGNSISSTTNTNCFYDNQLFSGSGAGSGLKTSKMVSTALQETLGTADWTYTDNMYPMIKTLENSEYMIMAATTIVLDAADELNVVKTKFHISTPHAVEWECDPISVVAFSGNNAYLAKTTLDQPAVVTASLGKLKKTFDLTIKAGVSLLQPDIVWNIPQTDFTYGDKLTTAMQKATESHGYEGHFEFNFDENHALSVGGHNLTATFIPNDEAQIAIKVASNAITVSKAKPTINWSVENGLEIYYGTDADEILKTAKATLNGEDVSDEGTFYYTIPALIVDSHVIKVKFISDNYESDEEIRNIIVIPATPTIAWAAPAPITYGTALSDLQLGAVSGVEGTFSYCEVINNADVALPTDGILNAGTHTLKAIFDAESPNYKDGEFKTVELVVEKLKPEIAWKDDVTFEEITYGETLSADDFAATVAAEFNNKGNILYLENGTAIDIYGNLTAGTHTITAKFVPTDDNYDTNTATATVKVNKAPANVQWSENLDAITYGEKLSETQLCATSAADGVQFTYTVTINGNTIGAMGAILPAGDERVINAVLPESDNYEGWNGYRTIKVNPSPTTITWDDPEDIFYGTLLSDEQLNATATAIINGETVTVDGVWTYEPGKNTKLNANDTPQELTVKFTSTDNNFQSVEETIAHIVVKKASPEIEWTNEQHLTYGASAEEIKVALENASAKFDGVTLTGEYEYTLPLTSDLQAGATDITAKVEFTPTGDDANNFESTSAEINIVVDKADPTITWEIADEDKTFTYGTGLSDKQLNATSNGVGDIVYTDNDENETVLDVDAILDAGTHTITATLPASDNYNEATATATITVNQAATEIEWETPAPIAYGIPISSVELNATANVDGTFTYELDGQNAENQTPEVGTHSIVATFTPTSNNYSGSTKTITLKVVQAAAEITWDAPEAITYGTPLSGAQLNATANVLGDFMYKPAEGSILPAGDTSISVIFIPESSDYGRATDTIKLTVNKAELSVSVADVTVNKGDAMPEFVISYNGFVNNENESVLTTAPTATCAASTDEVGAFDIIVSGGEADNYTFVYTKGTLTVVEAVAPQAPVITWAEPAAIVYGTLIDSTILNATANVKGTFKYSVNAGDALKAGTHELIATFTPADGSEAVTSTVKLTVSKATLSVSVADATVNQGDDMPQFTIDYKGFVLNENVSNLTTAPSAKCNATTDNAGTFDIVVSGGAADNYEFQYKNGKLTVNAKEDTTAITSNMVKVLVYPNPTTDVIFVETENGTDFIYVYNMAGKLVLTEANVGKTRVDLSNEPQGTYFVKVGEKTIKVLKF